MINRYSKSVDNTLEEFVPLPLEMMYKAGQAIQQRGDLAEEQRNATEVGLGSIETRASGHKDFINKFVNDFRAESAAALEKVGMNTSNPEFIREMNKIKLKYAADPRLQTIKLANEKLKAEEQIAANLKANGKLYIRPEFTGVDEKGNLTDNVQGVEAVNTLDEWNKQFSIAHQSMQNDGKGHESNRGNLARARQIIEHDIKTGGPASTKLMKAYMQQGMSAEQAKAAVSTQLEGMVNSYGVVDKRDWNYDQLLLQKEQMRLNQEYRKKALEAQTRKTKKEDEEKRAITPTFSAYTIVNTKGGAAIPLNAVVTTKSGKSIYGSGESKNGQGGSKISNTPVSGNLYVINQDDDEKTKYVPEKKTVNVKLGKFIGYKNVYVDKATGELVKTDKAGNPAMRHDKNGNLIAYRKGKPYLVEERTVAEYSHQNETILRVATRDEALENMGHEKAAYEGRYKNIKVDWDFVKQYYDEDAAPLLGASVSRIKQGTATKEDYDNIKGYQHAVDEVYYMRPGGIYESYQNQSKRSNITSKTGTYPGPSEYEQDKLTNDEINIDPDEE